MPTQTQILLFLFIPFVLIFIQVNPVKQCASDRACPDNYTCSVKGEYCCRNETCPLTPKCHC